MFFLSLSLSSALFSSALLLPVRGQNSSLENDPDTDNPTGSCSGLPGLREGSRCRELGEILFGQQPVSKPWRVLEGREEGNREKDVSLPPTSPQMHLRKQQFKGTVVGSWSGFQSSSVCRGGAGAADAAWRGPEVFCPASNSPTGGVYEGCPAFCSSAASFLPWSYAGADSSLNDLYKGETDLRGFRWRSQ